MPRRLPAIKELTEEGVGKRMRVIALTASALLVVGVAFVWMSRNSAHPGTASDAPVTSSPSPAFWPKVEVVATGLQVLWSLAFAPDGRLFFTERPGRLRVIVDGQVQPEPVAELPATEIVEAGLMGLALVPHFRKTATST